MHWLWLTTGLLLLMTVWVIGRFIAARQAERAGVLLHFRRLIVPRRCLRLLKNARKLRSDIPAAQALGELRPALLTALTRIRQELRRIPPLPDGEDGQPRMMALAYPLCDEEVYSASAMLAALKQWETFSPTPSEVAALPGCVAVAQCRRLGAVLRVIHQEAGLQRAAGRLLRKLRRAKDPHALLDRKPLPCAGLHALQRLCLHRKDERSLAALIAHLEAHGLTPDDLTQHFDEQQLQLVDELHRAMDCFTALGALDWLTDSESADDLHSLFLQDPSGAYPGMEVRSRYRVRLQTEMFSRRVHLDAAAVARQALALSQGAESGTAESCICHWFVEATGRQTLHASLRTRHGRLWARFSLRQEGLRYALLWAFALTTGLLFLHGRQPVFMLPFFAGVAGCVSRYILRAWPIQPPLRMAVQPAALSQTLIVLPAMLPDASAAERTARRLTALATAFPQDVHLLLLGDFAPSITPAAGTDLDVTQAVSAVLAAANDPRMLCLQRVRTWDSALHRYAGGGGSCGALFDLCNLIARGEGGDAFLCGSVAPSALERAYAQVLVLPEGFHPLAGALESLLSVLTHPLYSRVPTPKGWRGVSIVTTDAAALSEGMLLLRPDVFMEAVDELVTPSPAAWPLCGELVGAAFLPEAEFLRPTTPTTWEARRRQAQRAWRLLPWQLTHVQTPQGLVANPLGYFSRFRLRERLRETLLPLARLGLLLWAVLTVDWPLLLIAVAAPEIGRPFRRRSDVLRMLIRLSLLPMTAAVQLLGAYDALFRKRQRDYDFSSLEIWVQGVAVTVFTSLGFALPGLSPGGLILAALFALFPIAHRHE